MNIELYTVTGGMTEKYSNYLKKITTITAILSLTPLITLCLPEPTYPIVLATFRSSSRRLISRLSSVALL